MSAGVARDRSTVEVLLVGFEPSQAEELVAALTPRGAAVACVAAPAAAEARLRRGEADVVCLGPAAAGGEAAALLRRLPPPPAPAVRLDVVLAGGEHLGPFQDLLDEDRLFYLSRRAPEIEEVAELLAAAIGRAGAARRDAARAEEGPAAASPGEERLVAALSRQVAGAGDAVSAADSVGRAVRQLVDADRARCVLYDAVGDGFVAARRFPAGGRGTEEPRGAHSPAAGLIGWAIRTGRAVRLDRAADDARWDAAADGAAGERFLAVPLPVDDAAEGGAPPRPWAVAVATRAASAAPFTASDAAAVAALGRRLAPLAAAFARRREVEPLAVRRAAGGGGDRRSRLFRRRALEHHAGGARTAGRPLEISPAWTGRAFAVVVALFAAALAFASLSSFDQVARGPAVVRAPGRTDVTARRSGTVASIAVEPGEPIAAGQLLLRFDGAEEDAELRRIERELESALAQRLRDPGDRGVEARLQGLRASRDLAAARLEALAVRAPHDGVVGELRARPGRFVAAGEVLATLAGDRGELSVVAIFPGHARPLLRPGMPLRLELDGYRYAYQELIVERVSDEAVGAEEARRILGAEIGDVVPVASPVVFAAARLPSSGSFHAAGRDHAYHEGLRGSAEVRLRSERVLPALVPGLRTLLGDGDG